MNRGVNEYRVDFPLLRDSEVIYLDNAATSQRPACVLEAIENFYHTQNANPLRGVYELSVVATEAYESARMRVRAFLNAQKIEEIIFTRNTTESLNLVAYSYGLTNVEEGDEIVVSILEHHSNLLPWQMVAKQKKATLQFLECDSTGHISEEEIKTKITDKTKIVAITQVSNVLGVRTPLDAIISYAHEKGAVVVVDGAQSVPHMKVDVCALDADFFAFSGHKVLGPMGIGVLYAKEKLLTHMMPFLRGGEMIDSVTRYDATYAELPHKFEAGTVNASGAVGLARALDYIDQVGFDYIESYERELMTYALEKFRKVEHVRILGSDDPDNHSGILTFVVEGVHPHDVSAILDSKGIAVRAGHHCAQPLLEHLGISATTRASLFFYNTKEEVDALIAGVGELRRSMGYDE